MQVNEKKKKICETQKKYKKASSGSCCGRCFFGILIVAGIEYGFNIQEKNMGNLQNSYVKLDKVSKIYKMGEVEIRAVDNISFEISKGEFVVVVGPSGAGKTTVLNILGAPAMWGKTSCVPMRECASKGPSLRWPVSSSRLWRPARLRLIPTFRQLPPYGATWASSSSTFWFWLALYE